MQSGSELDFLHALQQLRNPALDSFFVFLNWFDTLPFYFLLVAAVWIGFGRKRGAALFYILLINLLVNRELKELFAKPRPCQLDPSLGLVHALGYSLPSGAAETYMLLSCLLISQWNSRWAWPVAITTTALISLSRVYLGIHYPTDIFAGWCVGLAVFLLVQKIGPVVEKNIRTWGAARNALYLLIFSQSALLLLALSEHSASVTGIYLTAMGIGFGLFFGRQRHLSITPMKRFLQITAGVAGAALFMTLQSLTALSSSTGFFYLGCFLLGLWVSLFNDLLGRILLSLKSER